MMLKFHSCSTHSNAIILFYEELEDGDISAREAGKADFLTLTDIDTSKDIEITDGDVTFHANIPATSIRLGDFQADKRFVLRCQGKEDYRTFQISFSAPSDAVQTSTDTLEEVSQALNTLSLLNSPRASSENGALGDATALLESELREVLHWRPRTNDTKGFLAALEQSFEETEVRGLPSFVYTPRSYTVTTDLSGEITGAQASLYARAKLAVDESLKLLDGLTPLADSFDEEEADAFLAIIRQRMQDLTDELARPAGPRVARLDELFDQLLGSGSGSVDAENVGGRLGDLRDEYALKVAADTVNTIEEEKTATDFRIIVDYLVSLHDAWDKARHFFNGQRRFLGTQLVWLERLLAAIAESSEEVRRALNSVLIGSLEQLSLVIKFDADTGREPILVDDLLDWVAHFASEEGPRLIEEGGRTAITNELRQTAELLRDTVFDSLSAERDDLPEEFFYPLVRSSFRQLYKHLDTLVLEAGKSALGGVVISSNRSQSASRQRRL